MSHSHERKEKICLNCGAALQGRFCHQCGQENIEPKETVWHLVSHFFQDITHFDGKFFSTGKLLFTRPGFLSLEYIKGRRASYLHPIRMYVFTSAFFFIIFFSLFNLHSFVDSKNKEEQLEESKAASAFLREKLKSSKDTVLNDAARRAIANIDARAIQLEHEVMQSREADSLGHIQRQKERDSLRKRGIEVTKKDRQITRADSIAGLRVYEYADDEDPSRVSLNSINFGYRSRIAYDSVQKELPPARRDKWLDRMLAQKIIIYNTRYDNNRKEGLALLFEQYLHSLPQALFVSLPLFALLLLMLYGRRNRYYVDHGIFAIHLYCATFIQLLIIFLLSRFVEATGWTWLTFIEGLFTLGIFFYLYKAMRGFYQQSRGKTILKFIILNILSFIVVMTLGGLFFLLSLIRFS